MAVVLADGKRVLFTMRDRHVEYWIADHPLNEGRPVRSLSVAASPREERAHRARSARSTRSVSARVRCTTVE